MMNSMVIPVDSIMEAARRPEVLAAMQRLYEEADRAIAEQNATCWNSGECCRFGRYGHRLFVTTLEVAFYVAKNEDDSTQHPAHDAFTRHEPTLLSLPVYNESAAAADTCPHAYEGRCHVRGSRPLGCRIFYCDPAAQHWQGPMTEAYLTQLRMLHEQYEVPYVYADWMSVLRALQAHGLALKTV